MKNIFLVDVDDTILDFHGVSGAALRVAFQENGVEWQEELERAYRAFNASLWESLERKELTREELMRERFAWFFKKINREEVDGYAVNRSFIAYVSQNPAYICGAEEFLAKLSQMGRIFFVTNGTESIQRSRFDIARLWEKAENTFISQRVGFDKPAKEYTKYVIAHIMNFDKERAVWIGDSLSADVKAAKEANITSIWYNPYKKEANNGILADYVAVNFEEILQILQKINENS